MGGPLDHFVRGQISMAANVADAWLFLVYSISRLSSNPVAMQVLHLAIATMTAYGVARYSPFPRLQKVLIIFGYLLFYEYADISRDYAIRHPVLVFFLRCVPATGRSRLTLLSGEIITTCQFSPPDCTRRAVQAVLIYPV